MLLVTRAMSCSMRDEQGCLHSTPGTHAPTVQMLSGGHGPLCIHDFWRSSGHEEQETGPNRPPHHAALSYVD